MAQSQGANSPSSIRNEKYFPCFTQVATEDPGVENLEIPSHHSAYIGEIVDVVTFGRLNVIAKDRKGKQINIAFYDKASGASIQGPNLKKGNVIVVLYPQKWKFLDKSDGFKIWDEKIKHIRIIPCSYNDLVAANDRYFTLVNNPKACANCGTPESALAEAEAAASSQDRPKKLLSCARCKIVKYCKKECQIADWAQHKKDCRALREVQWFSRKDWASAVEAPGRAPITLTGSD